MYRMYLMLITSSFIYIFHHCAFVMKGYWVQTELLICEEPVLVFSMQGKIFKLTETWEYYQVKFQLPIVVTNYLYMPSDVY